MNYGNYYWRLSVKSINEQRRIISAYLSTPKKTCQEVGSEFGVCKQTICNILKKHGVVPRGYTGFPVNNEDAFSKITPESSYWAGFLLSDGCVHWLRGKYAKLVVELQIGDWNHLEKLRRFLDAEIEVKPSHNGQAARLDISSDRLAKDLESLWITP